MRDTLKTIPGVTDVDVDFQRARATFKLDSKKGSPAGVAEQLASKTRNRYTATVIKDKS